MKRFVRLLLASAMAFALLGYAGALAAGEGGISVQLNGEMLSFTDAVPQVRAQRTFLPFRAVFEAMGAEVRWSADAPNSITAVKDGKTLTMTLGETAATVTENGVTTPIVMDVAPYASAGRTYVPVRFAAQAFGCAVGWDQAAKTAIIVDTDKLIADSMAGKQFTYLEQMAAHSQKYNEGIWDMDLTMSGAATVMGAQLPMSFTASGTTADQTKLSMDMNMTMDMTQLMALSQQIGGEAPDAETQAMLNAMKTDGIGFSMRGDLAAGKLYMNLNSALLDGLAASQLPTGAALSDTWLSMDMNALLAQSGLDMTYADLMQTSQNMDLVESLSKYFLSTLTPVSASGEGYGVSYQTFKDSAENLAYALSDAGFQKDGNTYTAYIDGGLSGFELKLTMKNGKVAGYSMYFGIITSLDESNVMEMAVTVSLDDKDQLTGKLTMSMAPMMTMDFDLTGGYRKGTSAPETEPPKGATVFDFMDLLKYGPVDAIPLPL